jgi:hypothetical protein
LPGPSAQEVEALAQARLAVLAHGEALLQLCREAIAE